MKRLIIAITTFVAMPAFAQNQFGGMMQYQQAPQPQQMMQAQQQGAFQGGQMPPGSLATNSYASALQPGQYVAQAPQGVGEHAAYTAPVARGCGVRGGYSAIEGGIMPNLQQAPPPSGGVYHP